MGSPSRRSTAAPAPTTYHAIVVEELSRSCSSTGFTCRSTSDRLHADQHLRHGRPEEKYLVPLATGKHLGAFVLTEPGAGTDVMAATNDGTKDGDAYVLNGTKTFISMAPSRTPTSSSAGPTRRRAARA